MARRKVLDADKIIEVSIWVKKKNAKSAKAEVKEIEKKYR